jgi:PAS domain S-box-containing protein
MLVGYVYPEDLCWKFFHYHLMIKAAGFGAKIIARPVDTLEEQVIELGRLLDTPVDVLMFRPFASGNADLLAMVRRARQRGVPLISLDGSVGGDIDVTTVSVGNEDGKADITEHICRRLNGQGTIAHLQGNQDMEAGRLRARGLHRALQGYPGVRLVFEESLNWRSPMTLRLQGQTLTRAALAAHAELDAIITTSDESAFGVDDVLAERGLRGKVMVTGFDALPEALIAIADGRLEASVLQPLESMAERALFDARRLVGEKSAPATHTALPAQTISRENLVDSVLQALRLFPNVINELDHRREEQHASAVFMETLIDNLPHILVVKDAQTLAYIRRNRAADEWAGVEPGALLGKTALDLYPEEMARRFQASDRAILASGVPADIPEELTCQPHTGARYTHTQNIPILDARGKPVYLLCILQDITERKLAEAELEEYSHALEVANAILKENREKLVAAEKMAALGSLVAGVAHELNTPIGNSLLAVSTLIDHTRNLAGKLESGLTRSMLAGYLDEAAGGADILERNLYRAANLISSFKQIAVDQSSTQPRRFALATLVSEVLLTLLPTLRKTVFEVRQSVPADIVMDSYPGPLEQVLINLVNNAVVHGLAGRESGQVTISADISDISRPGWVDLVVQDDGIGIPQDRIGRIFDPFFTTKSEAGGTGLGLSISHSIVTGLLGGTIEVSSVVGEGTRFCLSLPLQPEG